MMHTPRFFALASAHLCGAASASLTMRRRRRRLMNRVIRSRRVGGNGALLTTGKHVSEHNAPKRISANMINVFAFEI